MAVKCVAIGNRIMGDDSIAIKVVEELSLKLETENIEVIFGETDIDYALSKIDEGDFLFIVDATYFGLKPGSLTFIPIDEASVECLQIYSQHQPSLINLLNIYRTSVEGFIIGIEVEEISFSLELSSKLKSRFSHICDKVYNFIYHTTRGINHA